VLRPTGDALAALLAGGSVAERRAAVPALVGELHSILLGYDVDPPRARRLTALLDEVDATIVPAALRDDLAALARLIVVFADVEQLFLVAQRSAGKGLVDPSNAARLRAYLRRVRGGGAGVAEEFLTLLRGVLAHYGVTSLAHDAALERALMRLFATQQEPERRRLLVRAMLRCLVAVARAGAPLAADAALADACGRIAGMRALVADALADAAIEAREEIFQRGEAGAPRESGSRGGDPRLHGLDPDTAARIGLARLASFELERMPGAEDVYCFWGRSRAVPEDERLFVLAEVRGDDLATARAVAAFERVFLRATSALRSFRSARDPRRRLHWNRVFIAVEPVIRLDSGAMNAIARTLAPATYHLGLEKVVVRVRLASDGGEPTPTELVVSDPTGGRMELGMRAPETAPLAPATEYERSVVEARRRRLVYPYEIVRLLLRGAPGATFTEYDLDPAASAPQAVPVSRRPGQNAAGVVFGVVSTPTEKVPEGMRRVLVLSDPTQNMGSLTAAECDRAVAAIDLAERERLPVDWVPISAGARIAMDSGTENLDATARVARRIITFTERGGVIHVVVYGVNVGAQSYWNALATMVGRGRGVLIMTPDASMVLTGVGALAASGGVSAEDEVALGGFERIMGPNGEAQYYAPDLPAALPYARGSLPLHVRRARRVRAAAPEGHGSRDPRRDDVPLPRRRRARLRHHRRDLRRRDQPGPQAAVRDARGHGGARRPGRRPPRALALVGRRRDGGRLRCAPRRLSGLPDRHRERESPARGIPSAGRSGSVERRHALPAVVEEGRTRPERRERQSARGRAGQPLGLRRLARVAAEAAARIRGRDRARRRALRRPPPVPRRLPLPRRCVRRVLEGAEPAAARHGAQRLLRLGDRRQRGSGGRADARGAGPGERRSGGPPRPRGAPDAHAGGDARLRARARRRDAHRPGRGGRRVRRLCTPSRARAGWGRSTRSSSRAGVRAALIAALEDAGTSRGSA
jgi:hypothetical protein